MDELRKLSAQIAELASLPRIAGMRVALRLRQEIDEQYSQGKGPDGSRWAPLAPATVAKGRSAPPLTDTGSMRGATRVTFEANGIRISIPSPAPFHQYGTRNMPARPLIPDGSGSPKWQTAIDETLDEVAKKFPIYSSKG